MTAIPTARKTTLALSLSLAVLGLGACETYGPQTYSPYQQGMVSRVYEGVIVSYRPIEFGPGDTAGATVAGGVGGAVIGSAAAGWRSSGLGAVLGGIGGALIGNAVANGARHPGFAYLVRMPNGRMIEVPQASAEPFAAGTRVSVAFSQGRATITPFGPAYPPPPRPPGA